MRALIADDHPLYLDAARSNLERNFLGAEIAEARSFALAISCVRDEGPFDFILLDYFMPGMNGAAGVAQMVAASGGAAVAVMSGGAAQVDVGACIAAGARGFLPKTLDAAMFAAAVNMILIGGSYIPVEYVGTEPRIANSGVADEKHNLSPREMEVLEMIVKGATNKEIARKLEIQEVTVKLHANRIFNKLGVKNRAQAAVKALDDKIIRR